MYAQLADSLSALAPWQAAVVVLAFSLGGAVAVEFVFVRFLRAYVTSTETRFDEILLEELRLPLVATVALAGVFVLTRLPGVVEATFLTQGQVDTFFDRPSITLVVLLWAYAANRLVNRMVEEVKTKGRRFDFAPVFSNVWTLVVLVGAAALILRVWEIDITPLVAGAGVAGIAVGFAAKDTVANFFGGIALYFDDTYKIGDYIALDSGERGTVVKVGIRSTTLLTRDEVLVTVPNSVLNSAKIVNESAPQRRKRIRVPVGVAYGTDIDVFEGLLVELAEAESMVLDSPKPRARFRRFGESALEYELLCWVTSPTRASRVTHELNRAIYVALNEAGIEIPFPRRDVTVRRDSKTPIESAEATEATDGVADVDVGVDADVSD